MMSELERSRVRILTDAIYQNKLQLTPISRFYPTEAVREGLGSAIL
jgi:hypothetical protein